MNGERQEQIFAPRTATVSDLRHCRSCRAPMRFALTAGGRRIPLDEVPSETKGNVVLAQIRTERGVLDLAVTLNGQALERAREDGAMLRTAHFVTCPNADEHRRSKAARS